MHDPTSAERNLLFGILALKLDFINSDALVAGLRTWVLDKAKSLGQILMEKGNLSDHRRAILEALVQEHLELHGGDARDSLATVSFIGPVRQELEQVDDPNVQAILTHISAVSQEARRTVADSLPEGDPGASRPTSTCIPISSGIRFRILRPHARGGLGEVFLAHDEELHRQVALKEIQQPYAYNPESRARFLREARITGWLEHPGIVPVYGLGAYSDGRPFYAMRFIQGQSLQQAIEQFHADSSPHRDTGRVAVALRQLLGSFVAVCNVVAYAHSRGVLHRDIKPDNIMLGKFGETLVVDWGLAKPMNRLDKEAGSMEEILLPSVGNNSPITQAGLALGTPAYMSPEQAAGRLDQLGVASDVYSLGATLYCLLTGKAPFVGRSMGEVLYRVQQGDFLRPRQVAPMVSPALQAVCLKSMALHPEDRYGSARALADDIERWLANEPVSAYQEPWLAKMWRTFTRPRRANRSSRTLTRLACSSV